MKECTCGRCQHNICAKKVPIFSSLSDEELIKIVNMTGHEAFKKGEIICNEGHKSETLIIINEGKVKLSKLTNIELVGNKMIIVKDEDALKELAE
ncbi:hypothetical protein K154307017_17400 [Clostridium tetani]|nr:hypothetical protein K154307017_17400 [Clostridium tetani]